MITERELRREVARRREQARQKYNRRAAKHEAIEALAQQLLRGGETGDFRQSLRRCRTAAKQMLQGGRR